MLETGKPMKRLLQCPGERGWKPAGWAEMQGLGIHSGVRIGSAWTRLNAYVCVCVCGTVFKEYPCFHFVQNSKTRPEDNFKDKQVLLILKMGRKYVLLAHAPNYFLSCDLSLRDQGWGLWASHLRSLGFPFLISYSKCAGLRDK